MAFPAGEFDKRATFLRLPAQDDGAGNVRARAHEKYCERWARFRPAALRRGVEGGQLADHGDARLWVRPDDETKAIGVGFRVEIDGVSYAVMSVPPAQRSANAIEMLIQSTMV